jgi:polyisoprenoid-binding protein YceI
MKTLAALAPLLLATGVAQAVEYRQVQADRSAIDFSYQQMGVKMDGRFRKFGAQLRFDPAQPATAQLAIDVDVASIDAGSDEANDEAAGKAWFDTAAYPVARFVATAVKAVGPQRYEVAGRLTIKGRTQPLTVPATFRTQGSSGMLEGSITLHRADFAIGEGSWAKFDVVANDIVVRFRLATTAATAVATTGAAAVH